MSILSIFLHYLGGVTMALLFLYGTRNIVVSLIAGFIAFCVFYFSFVTENFDWQLQIIADAVKGAGIVYIISFVLGIIIYKIFPIEHFGEVPAK